MQTGLRAAILSICFSMGAATLASGQALPTKMCDDGVFIVGGTSYSFADIAVESTAAIDLNKKGVVTGYGYPELIHFGQELNDLVTGQLATVNDCIPDRQMMSVKGNQLVQLVLDPSDFTPEGWKDARRQLLKSGDGLFPQALVKLTGGFGILSDTYGLFFRVTSIEVLDTF